ncbi:MAG: hypothetical protein FWE55_03880, partial [Synergistaceae bacterium]|nr:hypothetical protein [Synergistaceae bacterium]
MDMVAGNEPPGSLPEICAPRDALMDTFSQSAKKQYTYVQAPAGYGKTISSLLWIKKAQRQFAWLTFDVYDNIIPMFYRSLCRSLLGFTPQCDAVSQFLSGTSFSTSPVESAMEFLSMLTWPEGKYTLVLDDFHNITNEAILKSLPYALRRLPSSMNVMILSRTALPDPMRIMEDNGKTSFIGLAELAFTPEEIRKHYANYGRFITIREAGEIHSHTDGWVIILNAIVLGGNLELSYEDHILSFEEFFEKNIWSGFDEETRLFLMKSSIVDSFTLELCERLTERPDCTEILDTLIRGNINLSHFGSEYRYHNLFLGFLRRQLQKREIDQKKLFYGAAEYYLETNDFYRAAVCSLSSRNKEIEMRVIQTFFKSKTPTLDQFYDLALVYDINKLTREECDRAPIRYMPNILATFLSGDIENTKRLFDMFYAALPAFVKLKHPIADVAITRLVLDFRVKLS